MIVVVPQRDPLPPARPVLPRLIHSIRSRRARILSVRGVERNLTCKAFLIIVNVPIGNFFRPFRGFERMQRHSRASRVPVCRNILNADRSLEHAASPLPLSFPHHASALWQFGERHGSVAPAARGAHSTPAFRAAKSGMAAQIA